MAPAGLSLSQSARVCGKQPLKGEQLMLRKVSIVSFGNFVTLSAAGISTSPKSGKIFVIQVFTCTFLVLPAGFAQLHR